MVDNFQLIDDSVKSLVLEFENEESVSRVESGFRLLVLVLSTLSAEQNGNLPHTADVEAVFDAFHRYGDVATVAAADCREGFKVQLDRAVNYRTEWDLSVGALDEVEQTRATEDAFSTVWSDISQLRPSEIGRTMILMLTRLSDVLQSDFELDGDQCIGAQCLLKSLTRMLLGTVQMSD